MKLPSRSRTIQLTEVDIRAAMDVLEKLRTEVLAAEVETELRRLHSKVRVLRRRSKTELRLLRKGDCSLYVQSLSQISR
jgi:hypothetical protein